MNENPISTEDLALWALGALDADEAARVERAVDRDPARAALASRMRAHSDLYDAIPDAPPAPAFETVGVDATPPARQGWAWTWIAAAAAVLIGIGAVGWWVFREVDDLDSVQTATVRVGANWMASTDRSQTPVSEGALTTRPAAVFSAVNGPAEARWQSGGRSVHMIANVGADVTWRSASHVHIEEDGPVWFSVEPARSVRAPDFVVTYGDRTVRVVGTEFVVAPRADRVAVLRGQVEVNSSPVAAGERWSQGGVAKLAAPEVMDWLPRATLTLAHENGAAGDVFLLTFRNPSAVTVGLPVPAPNRPGLWMEWLDRTGKRLKSLPIPPGAVEGNAWQDGALPPQGARTVWIRFRATERPAGAYRCRALVRPTGAPLVMSNPLALEDD